MKWYIWVGIAVLVIIIISLMISSSNKKKADAILATAANATVNPKSSFDPFTLTNITRQS